MLSNTFTFVSDILSNHPTITLLLSLFLVTSVIKFVYNALMSPFGFSSPSSEDLSSEDLSSEDLSSEDVSSSYDSLVVELDSSDNGVCLSSHSYDKSRYQTKLPKYKKEKPL